VSFYDFLECWEQAEVLWKESDGLDWIKALAQLYANSRVQFVESFADEEYGGGATLAIGKDPETANARVLIRKGTHGHDEIRRLIPR
jgi:hypothetical protein